ncbi:response regulator [Neobacillus sp. WH10]|uniref:response regulator transcription factor n=1 Tax=Neobacillus sp. WH10 TaxID=3047873 RepID=UPI0024C1D795|nr:response regulator [Neobacillus sp. WH10]WHY79947.1 response regulator [Neobacillus sp. WH10]
MKALIVDDEPLELLNIESILHSFDPLLDVFSAANGYEAYNMLKDEPMDIVCLDIRMPGWNGLETLQRIKAEWPHVKVMLISAHGEFHYAQEAIAFGASAYILKPVMPEELMSAIKKLRREIEADLEEHQLLLQAVAENWSRGEESKKLLFGAHLHIQPNVVTVIKFNRNEPSDKALWDAAVCQTLHKTTAVPQPINGHWIYLTECLERSIHTMKEKLSFLKLELAEKHQETEWLFGVGETVASSDLLKQSYDSAVQAALNKDEAVIQQCLHFLSQQYASPITLNQLAQEVHLSASHLSRIFKSQLGITFVDVLTKIRIKQAKELLENKELSIQFISDRVGFSSPDYFSSTFRKLEGISPSQFRLQKEHGKQPCS